MFKDFPIDIVSFISKLHCVITCERVLINKPEKETIKEDINIAETLNI